MLEGDPYARIVIVSFHFCACHRHVSCSCQERGDLVRGRHEPGYGRELSDSIRDAEGLENRGFFPLSAALNENSKLPENLRQRYIVANLSSTDENGFCKGVREISHPLSS